MRNVDEMWDHLISGSAAMNEEFQAGFRPVFYFAAFSVLSEISRAQREKSLAGELDGWLNENTNIALKMLDAETDRGAKDE